MSAGRLPEQRGAEVWQPWPTCMTTPADPCSCPGQPWGSLSLCDSLASTAHTTLPSLHHWKPLFLHGPNLPICALLNPSPPCSGNCKFCDVANLELEIANVSTGCFPVMTSRPLECLNKILWLTLPLLLFTWCHDTSEISRKGLEIGSTQVSPQTLLPLNVQLGPATDTTPCL